MAALVTTLDKFKALVAQGKIHYYIPATGVGPQSGGPNISRDIQPWVASTFKAQTVGGITLYDLTKGN